MPRDTDWHRWAMLHDGNTYRLYAMRRGADLLYQAAWDSSRAAYVFGYSSIPEISVRRTPDRGQDVAMLHDGDDFRLYVTRP